MFHAVLKFGSSVTPSSTASGLSSSSLPTITEGLTQAKPPRNSIGMSLVNLAHVCSHLNNVNKARLGFTSIPHSSLHLKLCLALQNSGFFSSVVLGGQHPPRTHLIHGIPSANADGEGIEPVTQSNLASRRLWLGLKYWQSEPVLGKMTLVSKPKRRIYLDVHSLREIARGRRSRNVDGLRSPGESLYLSTDQGIMEARDCVEKKTGGLALCRVH